MKRIYHPFWLWEDVGMWVDASPSARAEMVERAVEFTGDHALYGDAMMEVLDAFPIACDHNMSEPAMNRRAWVGHAAVFLRLGIPEDVTREAWGRLTDQQRELADAAAERAIHEWERRHASKDQSMGRQMEIPGL